MAEIKLNASDWNGLSIDDQNRIHEILEQTGLLKDGDAIVADANALDHVALLNAQQAINVPPTTCEQLCSLGETVAHTLCGLLPNPVTQAICNAAATTAGNICRDRCKGSGKSSAST